MPNSPEKMEKQLAIEASIIHLSRTLDKLFANEPKLTTIDRVGAMARLMGFELSYKRDRDVALENLAAIREQLEDDPTAYDDDYVEAAENWVDEHFWYRYFEPNK